MRKGSAPTSPSMKICIHSDWLRLRMRSRMRSSRATTSATVAMYSGARA